MEGHLEHDGAAIPAVLPQSSSRESGRISELRESKSTGGSQIDRKDEQALSSESLLSEEPGTDPGKSQKGSSRVHAYKLTERSEEIVVHRQKEAISE